MDYFQHSSPYLNIKTDKELYFYQFLEWVKNGFHETTKFFKENNILDNIKLTKNIDISQTLLNDISNNI